MGLYKEVKNSAYFSRFQTKFRRRREGKTHYRRRKRIVVQRKNKYDSPKYRFVVRFTNKACICQIIRAKPIGDDVLCVANSAELSRYGVPFVQNNYPAAYATGLLCARRMLQKLKMDKLYEGNTNIDGTDFTVECPEEGRQPFTAHLDFGLHYGTTGARVFAAMKGANDGGMLVPHSEKRFVGYSKEDKKLDPEVLRNHIFGVHIAEYQKKLQADAAEDESAAGRYEKLFSQYVKNKIKPDAIEGMWKKAHSAIRADPSHTKKKADPSKKKVYGSKKLTTEQRQAARQKKKEVLASLGQN